MFSDFVGSPFSKLTFFSEFCIKTSPNYFCGKILAGSSISNKDVLSLV